MHRRWKTSPGLVVTGVLAVVTLTACGGAEVTPSGSATTTTAGATTTKTATPSTTLEISDSSANQLCDMIRPELSNFRVQGPTLGRLALNTMVHEWALRNGGINGHVLADKAMIDRVTTEACPDVRTETLTALDLPNLAAGLAF
ncbi:hypothetical protein ACSVDM_05445 [Nocardia sp. JW2]|uniref:hypothetical protein n=1 Tax=Nocardia sp. JW2 TaxID=3450738 RepID=UPI003F4207DA